MMDKRERRLHDQRIRRFLDKADGKIIAEKAIEKKWNAVAKRLGWRNRKLQTKNNNADPDRIYFRKGETFLIEFKRTGEKPTELQLKRHEEWRDDGYTVLVFDYFDPLLAEAIFL